MKLEDNIFFAKRNLVDSIWKEAHIEGVNVTFPETQEIVEGRSVSGLSIDEILIINNLKHSWEFVLDTLEEPLSLDWIKRLHVKIGEGGVIRYAGDLRSVGVGISGTTWRPDAPDADDIAFRLAAIEDINNGTDKALAAFDLISRAQMFIDGNKRTAQLTANKILIENGCGILAIPIDAKLQFGTLLIQYYESGDPTEINEFLLDACIECPDF